MIHDKQSITEGCKSKDVDMWPLLNLVNSDLLAKISLIYAFGPSATEVVFTTTDNKVRTLYVL